VPQSLHWYSRNRSPRHGSTYGNAKFCVLLIGKKNRLFIAKKRRSCCVCCCGICFAHVRPATPGATSTCAHTAPGPPAPVSAVEPSGCVVGPSQWSLPFLFYRRGSACSSRGCTEVCFPIHAGSSAKDQPPWQFITGRLPEVVGVARCADVPRVRSARTKLQGYINDWPSGVQRLLRFLRPEEVRGGCWRLLRRSGAIHVLPDLVTNTTTNTPTLPQPPPSTHERSLTTTRQ
jgi:hypothetical protein